MKKSFIALAVLGAFAGAASAQSQVEVYGRIDLNFSKRTGQSTTMNDGAADGAGSSRIGFRGVEDLGGGLKAGFVIESQIFADSNVDDTNGNARTTLFGQRNSYIDLMGSFGTVRFGRHLNPALNQVGAYSAFGTDYGLGSGGTIFNTEGARYNNAVSYLSPNLSGFTAQVTLTTSENTGQATKAFRVNYGAGPLNVGLAYTTDGVAGTDGLSQLGASYNFGFGTLMALYEHDGNPANDGNAYSIGARIPVGAFGIRATYGRNQNGDAGVNGRERVAAIGFDYALSKRTGVYGVLARNDFRNNADVTQVTFGIGHNF